jgi:hypothetical protein
VPNDEVWQVERRLYSGKRDDDRYLYWLESYQEHIAGLYKAYALPFYDAKQKQTRQPLKSDLAYAFIQAEKRFSLPPGTLDKVARYIIAGHDVGKLGQIWQKWVHAWQQQKGVDNPAPPDLMLAHTDNHTTEHASLEKQFKKKYGSKPPHAAESAFSLLDLTIDLCGENNEALFRAINTAITRHHGAKHRGSVEAFKLDSIAPSVLHEAFKLVGLADMSLAGVQREFDETEELSHLLVEPEESTEMLLYFLLTRMLRLADQRSQQG